MKWFKEYEELLLLRYVKLYDEPESRDFVRQEKRNLIIKLVLLVLLICLIIGNNILAHRGEYKYLRFNKNGEITGVMRPDMEEGSYSFSTRVKITSDKGEREKEYYITIEPAGEVNIGDEEQVLTQQMEEEKAETELKSLISNLNKDTSKTTVGMPDHLENGDRLVWRTVENRDPVIYFVGMLVLMWLLYRSRFYRVRQEEKRARESIVKELPEFINKLILLLNAGVILNTAFLKIAEDISEQNLKRSYFYRRINGIAHMVNETNASFHNELYKFAKHSGVKELMRITNIMMDNVSKGDDLADKLRRENELLWFSRKQQAEEKGRLAETKMTMPLMILLMVLIMVATAPALMEI